MLKTILTTFAAMLPLVWLMPTEAAAQSSGARAKQTRAKAARKPVRVNAARPASVGQNGLCQNDTGTSTSQLDFRNRCDTEEFWRRMMDRDSTGGS